MRLIDAEEFDVFAYPYTSDEFDDGVSFVLGKIDEAMTIDPVRHGKWKWQLADNGWADHICSECGFTENTDIHVSLGWKYCPNCGAKMDKRS